MSNKNEILSALECIDPVTCSYDEWLKVGMALKYEGLNIEDWDTWSAPDTARYDPKAIASHWKSFGRDGSDNVVTAGTLFDMAKAVGWHRLEIAPDDAALDWDSKFESTGGAPKYHQVRELSQFLQALYSDDESACFVTKAICLDSGKWVPNTKGDVYIIGDVLSRLEKYSSRDGISEDEVIGLALNCNLNDEAGAWIRANPVSDTDGKDSSVSAYRYAVVESDAIPIDKQIKILRESQLPIATLTTSGGKSVHALVKVDAPDLVEYRKRVAVLYDYLESKNFVVDEANKNPSRLTRLAGIKRGNAYQHLVATNIGCKSWDAWLLDKDTKKLPPILTLQQAVEELPPTAPPIIDGLLREGHKMIVSGASKAGKSFLLMELAVATATGGEWIGLQCRRNPVLYINLEIDPSSARDRFVRICKARGADPNTISVDVWNLRGHAEPLDELAPLMIKAMLDSGREYGMVIIDPIYKVITGDENNASEMGYFCNQFDAICDQTGAAVVYCHHHSKGAQGAKKAIDRSSGSGVFARDPDAIVDIVGLEDPRGLTTEYRKSHHLEDYASPWRAEFTTREFVPHDPIDMWFEYPVHCKDDSDILSRLGAAGSAENANQVRQTLRDDERAEKRSKLDSTIDRLMSLDGEATVHDVADALGVTEKTIRSRIKGSDKYDIFGGEIVNKL